MQSDPTLFAGLIGAAAGLIGAVVGAIVTAWVGFRGMRMNRFQAEQELRWRQANLVREILDKMWDDPYAVNAMEMLESPHREYEIVEGKFIRITFAEVIGAITSNQHESPETVEGRAKYEIQRFIRDCFDHFFAVMQMLEHYINIGLVKAEDVTYPFDYYAQKMYKQKEAFEKYILEDQTKESLLFWGRFPQRTRASR